VSRDSEIAPRLLAYLATRWRLADLDYAEAVQSISGGFDTAIFGFALKGAPADASGRLILRLGHERSQPPRFALEAVTQNVLAEMGYLVPRVLVLETDTGPLGGPFLVMQRLAGKPLGQKLSAFAAEAPFATRLRHVAQLPATFAAITRTWVEVQVRLHEQPVAPLLRAATEAGVDERMLTFDGQLARLAGLVESDGLTALSPAVSWLKAHRPDDRALAVICHGDFHPLNIMADGDAATGVIDWANVVVAPPEMDVASAVANIATFPMKVPAAVSAPLRLLVATLLRRYVATHHQFRPLDQDRLRYYQVFRAMVQLRPALAGLLAGRARGGAFHSHAGVRNLVGYIRAQGGPHLKLPLPPS
jgi:aminoglycoside phosphotransferase (APT) family kinase protein